jgi:hypothetical protein
MKPVLLILRYFEAVSTTAHIITWLGLGLLPVVFISGIFWPGVGFGFAVWSFLFLLAVPSLSSPIALRNLLSNRRLMMMPRFAGTAVLTLFLHTLLTSAFLPFFAQVYEIEQFPDSALAYSFAMLSCYLLITFSFAGMQWGMQILGILVAPVIVVGVNLLRNAGSLPTLGVVAQSALVIAVLMGWIAALLVVGRVRHFQPPTLYGLKQDHQTLVKMGTSLGPALWSNASKGSPALSLMLGYPATNFSEVRLKLLAGILGPLPLVLVMRLADFNQEKYSWPELLQMLMFVYLFSATVMGFQNAELVARLRLLWLKAPRLREDLWKMLDAQHLLSQITFLSLTSLLAVAASLVLSFKPLLLLQYPLLLLALNAHTSYYSIYARIKGWSVLTGFVVLGICLSMSVWCTFKSMQSDTVVPLLILEAVLLGLGLVWRQLARARFSRIDWQALRPLNFRRGVA